MFGDSKLGKEQIYRHANGSQASVMR